MDWRSRVEPPSEAVQVVRPGHHVFIGSACATPRALITALEDVDDPPGGVQLIHFLTDGAIPVYAGGPYTLYQHKVFFVGRDIRSVMSSGKIDYVPISVAQVHRLLQNGRIPLDVAFVQLSPPDDKGFCSLGVSVDVTLTAVRRARTIVAEINPAMPRTHGDTRVHLDEIDHLVEVDTPVIEYVHQPADAVAAQIARYIARIIDDGSTLQIGIGRIPNEMLKYLTNRKDLGIHSDVITEPLVDLIEQGVVTGARKTLHPGQIVASYCMGTERLYRLIDDNPRFNFQPIHYVCDPAVIAANAKMVSVSQAFAIDLSGQVCADQFEGEIYGGVSTQPEFIRGAAASEEGKAIVCLASTTDDGSQSRIRPLLRENEGVTIARSDVHYVVTEYGIAYIFGKSIAERATALIEIAHPRFRESLLTQAREHGFVSPKLVLKSRKAYPEEEERTVTLRQGEGVRIRPTRATDAPLIQKLFYALPPEDVFTRFFTNLKSLDVSKAQHLCDVSYEDEMAFLAVVGEQEQEKVVGTASYYLNQATNLADVAFMIHPQWQGKGLGKVLQQRLAEYARAHGVRGFTADVLCENEKMISVFDKSGFHVTRKVVSGSFEVTMLFEPPDSTTTAESPAS